jgi:hypothetical protein
MADETPALPRNKRGKNWNEVDSVKLIEAYQYVQANKAGASFPFSLPQCLIALDGDNSGIIMDKIAARFNDSSPVGGGRSSEAVKERWKKLLESYRYPLQVL